jgi:hypothetical protein
MKLLIENFRKYRGEHDFKLLCENFDRGIITEQELYETWERQVLLEMDNLIEEGIMDILQQGYQKGKELFGQAKEIYDAAVQKVSDFILRLSTQAFMLMEKAKVMLAKIAGVLRKAYNFVQKFCKAHPILCKVIKILIIMMIIAAVMALFANAAQASVDTSGMKGAEPGTYTLSDEGVEALKATLSLATEDKDPEVQQAAVDAFNWLQKAHQGSEVVDLAQASGKSAEYVKAMYRVVETSSPEEFSNLVKLGKKTIEMTNSYSEQLTAGGGVTTKSFSWASLRTP